MRQFLSNENMTGCPRPPYSLHLAPFSVWLFSKVKTTTDGECFELIHVIKVATTAQLKTLTKGDFQGCFRKRQDRWAMHARSEGSVLRSITGNVSCTEINYFLFKHSRYFFPSPLVTLRASSLLCPGKVFSAPLPPLALGTEISPLTGYFS